MSSNYNFQNREIKQSDYVIPPVSLPMLFHRNPGRGASVSLLKNQIHNRILKSFSPEILQELSPYLERVHLKKGQVICEADDNISSVYFPETAVITEFQILSDGKATEVAMIGSEGMHGAPVLLGSPASTNWAQVLVAGTVFKISAEVLVQFFEHFEIVRKCILEYLNLYLRQISQKAVCNNLHQLDGRLSSWMLMLDDRCQSYPLQFTQEQFAFFLGVNRPSISIMTQNLREKGIIHYRRGRFSVINRELLELNACSCYQMVRITPE